MIWILRVFNPKQERLYPPLYQSGHTIRLIEIANEIASIESELVQREEEWLEITLKLDS